MLLNLHLTADQIVIFIKAFCGMGVKNTEFAALQNLLCLITAITVGVTR
jgi:hypothetical protein